MAVRRGPNGIWRVEFQLAGVRIYRSARTRDRRAAEALERKLRQEVFDRRILGAPRKPIRFTLGEAVDRYVTEHLRPSAKSEQTLNGELYTVAKLVRYLGGRDVELREITSGRVAELKRQVVGQGWSKATANGYLATLRAILRKAHREWEVLPVLPVFQPFPVNNGRTRTLSDDEECRLLRAAEANPSLSRLFRFLLATGARLGEALRLTWPDVVLEPDPRPPRATFHATKNGSTRSVPLPASAVEMLGEMREAQRTAGFDQVFLCVVSHRWLQPWHRPHGAFRRACKAAGVDDFRLHDARHTYASRLARAGVSLYKIGRLLGHRDPRMTARYSHLESADLDEVTKILDRR